MEIYSKYARETRSYFLKRFEDAVQIEEKSPENDFFWQLIFKIGTCSVFISSEYGFLDFQVLTSSSRNLSIRSNNTQVFSSSLETNSDNIHLVIDFLFEQKDQIFKE